jgi:hypothetical protein
MGQTIDINAIPLCQRIVYLVVAVAEVKREALKNIGSEQCHLFVYTKGQAAKVVLGYIVRPSSVLGGNMFPL